MENKEFLQSLLMELKKPIPHQWRVQSYSKKKPVATVMAYIDARDCMDALDAYAVYGWHREHYVVDGKVYCKVGIVMPDGSIMWRSDCGVESQADAEKGQSSDSFKRACVNFGIGRFLYDLGVEYVTTNEPKTQSNYPYCIDEAGKQIWDLTKYVNDRHKSTAPKPIGRSNPELPKAISDQIIACKSRAEVTAIWNNNQQLQANEKFVKLIQAKSSEFPKPQNKAA